MEAYVVNGNNYVKLRDIGEQVGFNVYWDSVNGCVQVESGKPYTGVTPQQTAAAPADGSRYVPKVGDVIRCDDGTDYTIKDVSRWDKSAFSSAPLGDLPAATCDWSKLPQPEMPWAEARHFTSGGQDYLFQRNLYETRRMLYTLYNAIGDDPETWQDGQPVKFPSGNDKVKISLAIPAEVTPQSFCFDIQDLGENLKSVGLLVMLDAIYNRVIQNRKAGKFTHVYIDEIYLFFANGNGTGHSINNYSSEFLYKCWKRFRKSGAMMTGITQNLSECLLSNTARQMLANSEFLLMLNQAATDREQLARLLGASDTQMSYVDNAPAGHGLIKVGGAIVPFSNELPKNTELYRLMSTKPGED